MKQVIMNRAENVKSDFHGPVYCLRKVVEIGDGEAKVTFYDRANGKRIVSYSVPMTSSQSLAVAQASQKAMEMVWKAASYGNLTSCGMG